MSVTTWHRIRGLDQQILFESEGFCEAAVGMRATSSVGGLAET